jgi:hypothetical protein
MTREDEIVNSLMDIRRFADNSIHPLDDYSLYSQLIDLIDKTICLVERPLIKKELTVQVPNEYANINQNAFNEWIVYKKYKNKGAITKTLNMLNKYDFQTQQEMVDKSIMNEYKGLFEPKQSQPYNTPKSQTLNTNINVWDAIERKGITNG